ncbi:MAG TPA: cation diffusion facilitator family transporter [Candidatus Bathyarchaeia archaeon]|nr:cation diffusion facilitator family transporter [Candidatus Bathyarchaeia archaeon]
MVNKRKDIESQQHFSVGKKRLTFAIIISVLVMVIEIVGWSLSNSLALLSDAGHVLTDVLTLALGLLAIRFAERAHTSSMTYGFHRAEILAALANGVSLIGIALYIFYEAFLRFFHPPEVQAPILLGFAVLALLANIGTAKLLLSVRVSSLNLHAAFLHVAGDTLGSLGVVLGGIILYFTGITVVDPIIAAIIGCFILKNAVDVTVQSATVLLEGVPSEIDLQKLTQELLAVPGVQGVHELHVWCIASGFHALTGHVTIEDQKLSQAQIILDRITELLREKFSIMHVTLQPEVAQVIAIDREKNLG